VTVYYLVLNSDININNLLSELYWRNSKGNSYPDVDSNKIAPGFDEYNNPIIHT
jgi:hypothetical protein